MDNCKEEEATQHIGDTSKPTVASNKTAPKPIQGAISKFAGASNKDASNPLQGTGPTAHIYIGGVNYTNTSADIIAHMATFGVKLSAVKELTKLPNHSKYHCL